MIKATVIQEGRHPGDMRTVAVLELSRVPLKGEYLNIKGQRYRIIRVEFLDNGKVVLEVG